MLPKSRGYYSCSHREYGVFMVVVTRVEFVVGAAGFRCTHITGHGYSGVGDNIDQTGLCLMLLILIYYVLFAGEHGFQGCL